MAYPWAPWGPPAGYWALPGSSYPSTMTNNPQGVIRDMTTSDTNAAPDVGPDDSRLAWYEDWGKNEEYCKIIMDVLKSRLALEWPYNYKALLILGKMPVGAIVTVHDQVAKLADVADAVRGAEHLKKLAKPIFEKSSAEKKKQEDEANKKKAEAITAMWGGLWTNNSYTAPALASAGWNGWPYPYPMPPGVAEQLASQWKGKNPEGWQPAPITALPQVYPFSRTAYYGLSPNKESAPPGSKPAVVSVNLNPS
ncbi:hypothetical protein L204_104870 [Cryptococcus depauperatus]|nr:hypothetical protein L204_05380 [Cryptococcus depauperatus CBS 7855]